MYEVKEIKRWIVVDQATGEQRGIIPFANPKYAQEYADQLNEKQERTKEEDCQWQ